MGAVVSTDCDKCGASYPTSGIPTARKVGDCPVCRPTSRWFWAIDLVWMVGVIAVFHFVLGAELRI